MSMDFRLRLLLAAVCLTASLFAQSPASSLTSDAVYDKNCAKCHGKTAEGRHFGGPSLATSKLSPDETKAIIMNGKGRMPKYAGKLTEDQIAALASEIKALSSTSK
jgi:mono/diheme cytochrome c family protein